MVRLLSLESLAAAHQAGQARMWARLRQEAGEEGVAELCEELDLDPARVAYPPDVVWLTDAPPAGAPEEGGDAQDALDAAEGGAGATPGGSKEGATEGGSGWPDAWLPGWTLPWQAPSQPVKSADAAAAQMERRKNEERAR